MVLRVRGGKKLIDLYKDEDKKKVSEKNYLSLNIPPPRKDDSLEDFPDRMSCSRIQSFMKCPFYFKLQYLDGFKVAEDSEHLSRGKELHDMFYYASMTGMPEVIRSFDGYNKYPDHCENFIEMAKIIQRKAGYKLPLMAETEIYDPEDKVLLYLDRIDVVGKQTDVVELLDYKTGAPKRNIWEYKFQLALYTYYVEKILKLKVKRWGVMFTGENGDLIYEPVDRAKVDMIPEMIRLVREGISDCHIGGFDKRRNNLCYHCKFRAFSLCDGAVHQKRAKHAHGLLEIYRYDWSRANGVE